MGLGMPRLLTKAVATSVLMSVTGSAFAVYPSFVTFENDTDNYTPNSRDMYNDTDPELDGLPPVFPGPPSPQYLRDVRVGRKGVIEEVASNAFATVPTASSGNF